MWRSTPSGGGPERLGRVPLLSCHRSSRGPATRRDRPVYFVRRGRMGVRRSSVKCPRTEWMPYDILLPGPPMGIAAEDASGEEGRPVKVAVREFTSSEDGDEFI